LQFLREKNFKQTIPPVKVAEEEEITHEKASATLRRSVNFFSALKTSDGHWPAENSGVLFFHPPLVSVLESSWLLFALVSVNLGPNMWFYRYPV